MPICIHCRHPIPVLYTTYSKADDRALGKGVRLTQCPSCHDFADKYVEHDFIVLFIDLVLIKAEVRHLSLHSLHPIPNYVAKFPVGLPPPPLQPPLAFPRALR
jgi:hypothetical protein